MARLLHGSDVDALFAPSVPPRALAAARSAGLDLDDPVLAQAFAEGMAFAELLARDAATDAVESAA